MRNAATQPTRLFDRAPVDGVPTLPSAPKRNRREPSPKRHDWQVDVSNEKLNLSGLLAKIRYIPLRSAGGLRGALYEDTPLARERLTRLKARHPMAANCIFVAPKSRIQSLWAEALGPALTRHAREHLLETSPQFSAKTTAYRSQKMALLALTFVFVSWALIALPSMLIALNVMFALFYAFVGLVRLASAFTPLPREVRSSSPPPRLSDEDLPIYTVLVPLYDEVEIVPELIAGLVGLDYPVDKLDIMILAESDDAATLSALAAQIMPPHISIIKVPPSHPRTKPKALNFALPLGRGSIFTIYDAEDKPEPDQLRKAVWAFREADQRPGKPLGCVQAALTITNSERSFFTRHFAFEYMALFDALLPALSQLDLPIPLGGTSNHFRRDALVACGGWDPYNVTEDADLGIRLARLGYRTQMIASSTREFAPVRFLPWLRQRSRWFKGWWQTWLVHMRHPLALAQRLGLGGFLTFQMIMLGVLVSVLIHPFFFAFTVAALLGIAEPLVKADAGIIQALASINVANFFLGYLAAAALGLRGAHRRGVKGVLSTLATIPVYWLFLSLGGFVALWELRWRPHHWHKTPHDHANV